jgi:hypothetical protein
MTLAEKNGQNLCIEKNNAISIDLATSRASTKESACLRLASEGGARRRRPSGRFLRIHLIPMLPRQLLLRVTAGFQWDNDLRALDFILQLFLHGPLRVTTGSGGCITTPHHQDYLIRTTYPTCLRRNTSSRRVAPSSRIRAASPRSLYCSAASSRRVGDMPAKMAELVSCTSICSFSFPLYHFLLEALG